MAARSSTSRRPAPPSTGRVPPRPTSSERGRSRVAARISSPSPRLDARSGSSSAGASRAARSPPPTRPPRCRPAAAASARRLGRPSASGTSSVAPLAAERGFEHVRRPVAAVRDGQRVASAPAAAKPGGERGRGLDGRQDALEASRRRERARARHRARLLDGSSVSPLASRHPSLAASRTRGPRAPGTAGRRRCRPRPRSPAGRCRTRTRFA